ncbi:MAG: MBOAT family protein [Planctomycetota bacterium]|nr:MBOAT family protein [Planctomycetota bacterium]
MSTAIDWIVGAKIGAEERPKQRKWWLWLSLAVNISLLGTFKYMGFFVDSANALLEAIGMNGNIHTLKLILPVGISFYTFQTLSYSLDIYYRKIKPHDSVLDFALFVGFFPQLVAGPIVRARDFLPQLKQNPMPTREDLSMGIYHILSGLFKKVIIADVIGADLAQPYYSDPDAYGFFGAMAGIYGFAFQLFGDFAGYSQMAIGCALLLGFRLPKNFDNPFMARNNLEIWRRWHITLLTWMRDYIYIPLGGSRGGENKTYRNIMITNIFSGVWHGAGLNFVIWGIVDGITICFSRMFQMGRKARNRVDSPDDPILWIWWQRFFTFHIWLIAMPIFRTQTLDQLAAVGQSLVRLGPASEIAGPVPIRGLVLIVLALAMTIISEYYGPAIRRFWRLLSPEVLGVACVGILGLCGLLATEGSPFIYFQF